jgi:hypothetical protein
MQDCWICGSLARTTPASARTNNMTDSVDPGVMDCPPSILDARNKQNENAVVKFRRSTIGIATLQDCSSNKKALLWSGDQRAPMLRTAVYSSPYCRITNRVRARPFQQPGVCCRVRGVAVVKKGRARVRGTKLCCSRAERKDREPPLGGGTSRRGMSAPADATNQQCDSIALVPIIWPPDTSDCQGEISRAANAVVI